MSHCGFDSIKFVALRRKLKVRVSIEEQLKAQRRKISKLPEKSGVLSIPFWLCHQKDDLPSDERDLIKCFNIMKFLICIWLLFEQTQRLFVHRNPTCILFRSSSKPTMYFKVWAEMIWRIIKRCFHDTRVLISFYEKNGGKNIEMITNLQYTFHKILLTFFTYFTTIHTHALYMKDSEIH